MFPRYSNCLSHWKDIITATKLQHKGKSFFTKNRAFTLPLPSHIVQPPYASTGTVPPAPPYPEMKTDIEINHMRKACSLAREVLNIARDFAKVITVGTAATNRSLFIKINCNLPWFGCINVLY